MANQPLNGNFSFDVELTRAASTFNGTSQQLLFRGTATPAILQNNPVMILIKNQTTVSIFFADNSGSTEGTTMIAGEHFVLDCRGNKGNAPNGSFPIGTAFFVTGVAGGAGSVNVSIIYAK